METSIIKIGNSQGLIIPQRILKKFGTATKVKMVIKEDGSLVITPASEYKPRKDWENIFLQAIEKGEKPDEDLFEGIQNKFDEEEWSW